MSLSPKNIKRCASDLKEVLADFGYEVKLTHSQEVVARLGTDSKNWRLLLEDTKSKSSEPVNVAEPETPKQSYPDIRDLLKTSYEQVLSAVEDGEVSDEDELNEYVADEVSSRLSGHYYGDYLRMAADLDAFSGIYEKRGYGEELWEVVRNGLDEWMTDWIYDDLKRHFDVDEIEDIFEED